jgi:hypothetical protein
MKRYLFVVIFLCGFCFRSSLAQLATPDAFDAEAVASANHLDATLAEALTAITTPSALGSEALQAQGVTLLAALQEPDEEAEGTVTDTDDEEAEITTDDAASAPTSDETASEFRRMTTLDIFMSVVVLMLLVKAVTYRASRERRRFTILFV